MCRETSKGRYCETVQCRWNRSLYERTVSSDPVVLGIQGCTVANLKITPDDYKRLEPLELCKSYEFSLYSTAPASQRSWIRIPFRSALKLCV